jgi:hypothetical protein
MDTINLDVLIARPGSAPTTAPTTSARVLLLGTPEAPAPLNHATDLTDEQWRTVEAVLPPRKPRIGRPGGDLRRFVNGILWVQRTGGTWRNMPARYGCWSSVASRYQRWRRSGVWERVEAELNAGRSDEVAV